MRVIELSKFKPTKDRWGMSSPWTISFVYTPTDSFVLKGMHDEVKEYIKKNCRKAVYHYTYWRNGISRGGWSSTGPVYITEKELPHHLKYEISVYPNRNGKPVIMYMRRIPHKWIDFYDNGFPPNS